VKGKPNTTGLIKRKHFLAPEDAVSVRHLKEAGAVLTCLTNTSEVTTLIFNLEKI
jgi:Asp-tRNA(Asn)/Glu-tRNA(Gln) amidotransferase A subunit family amidase